jgi:hypothetical protein
VRRMVGGGWWVVGGGWWVVGKEVARAHASQGRVTA